MAWELTWPLSLIDLAVIVMIHGVLDVEGETLDSIWAVAAFFVVSPWVVRRAVARPYGALHGALRVTVAAGSQERARLTYQESLKVMWLLAWRALVLSLAALLVISGALRLAGVSAGNLSNPGPFLNALGLSAIDALSSIAFYPLLIPGMLRKRFRGFHLEVREAAPQPQAPVRKTRRR